MAKKKQHKTLYFVTGVVPNEEQQLEIDAINGLVCIRNAVKVQSDDNIEDFDYVAGDVPPVYAKAAAIKAEAAKDEPDPPKASTDAPAAPQQAVTGTATPKPGGATAWKAN
jgi:hypothetical protein